MLEYCNQEYLRMYASCPPNNKAETPLKMYSEERQKEIKKKPFVNNTEIFYDIFTKDFGNFSLLFTVGYRWNGANIPPGVRWLIGPPSHPAFLEASKIHDKLCENHYLVNNNRYLSSLIFREVLIASGVSKVKAYIMFHAVDNYQKLVGKW